MKTPLDYHATVSLRTLDKRGYEYIQNDSDIQDFLDTLGFPKRQRKNITGLVVIIGDGDIEAAWVSESSRPYDLSSWYHPLPFYRSRWWVKRNLPVYWLENNDAYSFKAI
jgi:hypothetical protein